MRQSLAPLLLLWPLCGCTAKTVVPIPPDVAPVATQRADALLPLIQRTAKYRRNGQPVRMTIEPGDTPARWRVKMQGFHTTYLRRDDDGTVLVEREEDLGQNVSVSYEPALVLLPALMSPGEPFEQEPVRMTVRNLSDGQVRDEGTCGNRVELLGGKQVQTPAGDFDVTLVRTVRSIRLALAQAHVVIDSGYHPHPGLVHERVEQTTVVAGLFQTSSVEEVELVAP